MYNSYLLTLVLTLVVGSLGLTGCAGFGERIDGGTNPLKNFSGNLLGEDEPEFVNPRSMVAIWKPSTYEKPGTKSLRGFGGRFYFHDAANEPVKVDGTLTIYGYDDAIGADGLESEKADRKFIFEADTLQKHYSASGIGHSYSFWVPWDEVGGEERTITLIPVFKSANGEIPQSQPSTLRLPGRKREIVSTAQESLYGPGTQVISASGIVSDKPSVAHAVAIEGVDSNVGGNVGRNASSQRTTTLRLPPGLAKRMAGIGRPASEVNRDLRSKVAAEVDQTDRNSIRQTAEMRSVSEESNGFKAMTDTEHQSRRPVFGQPGSF